MNRRKIKSIKDSTDLKIGNTAEIHKNYFGVHNIMIGPLLQILQQFIAKQPKKIKVANKYCIQIIMFFVLKSEIVF